MELVPEELGTSMPSMTIINPEKATFRPVFILSMSRFGDVQNN
jgi:hypothetical protein